MLDRRTGQPLSRVEERRVPTNGQAPDRPAPTQPYSLDMPRIGAQRLTERWLNDPQMRDQVLADSPIGRAAKPEDIAALVLFLASDLANIVTGAVYLIDGARTAH